MNDVTNVPPKIRRCAYADAAIITFMVCCVFAASSSLVANRPDRVVVFRQNSVIAEYPIGDDIAFTVKGKRGPVGVEVRDRAASIHHTDCPRKTCQMSGAIRRSREQLICAPNNILIEIRSTKNDDGIDGISY